MKKIAILFVINLLLIIFIAPKSWYIIALFVLTLNLLIYLILKLFIKRKFAFLTSLFAILISILLISRLLDALNTLLLVALYVGLLVLLR